MEEKVKLLNLLYPEGYPSDWLHSPDINTYLHKLESFKLEDLLKEPKKLEIDSLNIQEQTQDLVVTNYKTFIETAECSRELFTRFNSIETRLDQLLNHIPDFNDKCHEFSETTSKINNLRKLNSLTLTKNAKLLEVLELSQLMNSFIKDELYEDALELEAYVRKLCSKFGDVPIFQNILNDVNAAWLLMLHQLLTQLKQELTLPKCLEIVGHLRRMKIFSDLELKLKFLQCRGQWLDHCVKYIPKEDAAHHLTKTIELTRVNLFNIITQYKAIFNDDEVVIKGEFNASTVLFSWINDRISDFLRTLQQDLPLIPSLDSSLEQCMYFGLSFSKVGCDFRPLLVPIFTEQILHNFQNSLSQAVQNFEKDMQNFTLINKNLPGIPWKNQDPLHPPDSLLEFYPLAEFLNRILKTFNGFRECAPISIVQQVTQTLQNSLIFVAKSINFLHLQEQQAFTASSKDACTRLCMTFADDLVPYVQKCLHIVYPPNQIAVSLGISVKGLQDEQIGFLDREATVEGIRHLLPEKVLGLLGEREEELVNRDVD